MRGGKHLRMHVLWSLYTKVLICAWNKICANKKSGKVGVLLYSSLKWHIVYLLICLVIVFKQLHSAVSNLITVADLSIRMLKLQKPK